MKLNNAIKKQKNKDSDIIVFWISLFCLLAVIFGNVNLAMLWTPNKANINKGIAKDVIRA